MCKSLYNERLSQTDAARNLGYQAVEAIKNIIDEHILQGYSPHEIEQVIQNELHLHVMRIIINLRTKNNDFLVVNMMPPKPP